METYYKIAGLTVYMDTFGRTLEQAQPYRCPPAEADMKIVSDWQLFQKQQPHLSKDDCEYMSTCGSFYRQLISFDGMMLHASAVIMDGKAYLFSAPCGTGKSTHTRLWLERFGDRAQMLNDDKPALRLINGTWYAYGTPWSGKYDISTNIAVPLAGIAMIEQSPENSIVPFTGAKAVLNILDQTVRPRDPQLRTKMMDLVVALTQNIPIWKLRCNMRLEAADVSYAAMSGQNKENTL